MHMYVCIHVFIYPCIYVCVCIHACVYVPGHDNARIDRLVCSHGVAYALTRVVECVAKIEQGKER